MSEAVRTADGSPSRWAPFGIATELAFVFAVCHVYGVEAPAFRLVLGVAFLGWLVQHVVPVRFRLGWFLGLFVVSLVATLGVQAGLWVVGLGGAMVALCLLPGSRWRRLAAVGAAAGILALFRAGPEPPFALAVWPVFASLFLFRAITFLYDRHHEREAPAPGLVAAYFFLPPNVCFPVFPVVDFGTFRRGYEPAAGADVHQEGVERIVRGLLQLLAYRLVYQLAVVPIEAVTGPGSAVQHLVTNVFLIVRIMGMFHVSVGVLHLFGFRLPPTTHLPFLSPGFSEFWRRANVYWRDFVVKVFFYPVYFQLKGWGRRPAQALATLATFAAAWFLHSYQWFWFKGDFPLRWQDGVYWSSFGLLVMLNGLWLTRAGAKRRAGARASLVGELARAARIAGTFAVFATLWSIWMTPSLAAWLQMGRAMASEGLAGLVPVAAVLFPLAGFGLLWPDASPAARGYFAGRPTALAFARPWQSGRAVMAALGALLLVAAPSVTALLPARVAQGVTALAESGPNTHDRARRTEAYYQDLVEIPRLDAPGWQEEAEKPAGWLNWHRAGLSQRVPDVRRWAYLPSVSRPFKLRTMTTNAFGMRDVEYTKEKPPGVVRIAVLGASPVAGSGVGDGEAFEALLEEKLREEGAGPSVEILNFAVPGYRPVAWLHQVQHVVGAFEPDWVVVASAKHVWSGATIDLAAAMAIGIPIGTPSLRSLTVACAKSVEERGREARRRQLRSCLAPENPRLIEVVAAEMATASREQGFRLAYLQLPTFGTKKRAADASFVEVLEAEGFEHLDISDCWEGHERHELRIAKWDLHPNPFAHGLIAACAVDPVRDLLGLAP